MEHSQTDQVQLLLMVQVHLHLEVVNFTNVTTNGTGTITLGDALAIANDLTIDSETTLDVSGSSYYFCIGEIY